MLMQFCKGAGCVEIAGMREFEDKKNYSLIRPLLHLEKSELLEYLHKNNIRYFEDESNNDESIKRNSFRHQHTKPLLEKYLSGIKKSFEYLDEDRESLTQEVEIFSIGDFCYFKSSKNKRADIFTIDKYLKQKSHMPSANERELLKTQKATVLGRKYLVVFEENYIFISPYIQNTHMPKEFKEQCRVLKIEPKLRAYLFENQEAFLRVKGLCE
jgi:tRNA(Ile)-lysidine synthase